jgi:hypothetical protein
MVAVQAEFEAREAITASSGRLSADKSEKKSLDDEGIDDEAAHQLPPQNTVSNNQPGHCGPQSSGYYPRIQPRSN